MERVEESRESVVEEKKMLVIKDSSNFLFVLLSSSFKRFQRFLLLILAVAVKQNCYGAYLSIDLSSIYNIELIIFCKTVKTDNEIKMHAMLVARR